LQPSTLLKAAPEKQPSLATSPAGFSLRGLKTLIVGVDFQGNLTMMYGYETEMTPDDAAAAGVSRSQIVESHFGSQTFSTESKYISNSSNTWRPCASSGNTRFMSGFRRYILQTPASSKPTGSKR
jgi:hypothetical protein